MTDGAFVIRQNGQEVWLAIVDGTVIPADFTCKGAAEAAIPVERRRRHRKFEGSLSESILLSGPVCKIQQGE